MIIRESTDSDLSSLLEVERKAFGNEEGLKIVELVKAMLNDPTAKPLLSLLALNGCHPASGPADHRFAQPALFHSIDIT